jgi:DNA-binding NtrC family response regulator
MPLPRDVDSLAYTRLKTHLRGTMNKQENSPAAAETILLVEDEEQILRLCQIILEDEGYKVIATNQPREAVVLAKRHAGEIHLLITDVVMPDMDGKRLKEQISESNPGIKVLYMSGYTADLIALRGILADGINFIQKPFRPEDLLKIVRQILDR